MGEGTNSPEPPHQLNRYRRVASLLILLKNPHARKSTSKTTINQNHFLAHSRIENHRNGEKAIAHSHVIIERRNFKARRPVPLLVAQAVHLMSNSRFT